MTNLYTKIIEFLFPLKCFGCGIYGVDFCNTCIENVLPPKLSNYSWITSFGNYHDPIMKDVMWHIKKYPNGRLATILAKAFGNMIANRPENPSSWILVPVPISKKRWRERGFNQAELFAKSLAQIFQLQYAPNLLIKTKHTNKQGTAKSKEDRAYNILGSFSVAQKFHSYISHKNIILIDDITTTGSTLIEARDTLLEAGAQRVIAWTIVN